jgi:hypothetical protein
MSDCGPTCMAIANFPGYRRSIAVAAEGGEPHFGLPGAFGTVAPSFSFCSHIDVGQRWPSGCQISRG